MKRSEHVLFPTLALIVLAMTAVEVLAQADDEGDEEAAARIETGIGKLAFVADSFSKVEEGESVAVDGALEVLDELGALAREIESDLERKDDASGAKKAGALDRAAADCERELGKYAADKSTPKLCAEALREVIEAGEDVIEILRP